jgi:uncharacterized membrane protein
VRDVITLWTPPEVAKETEEDAVLFRIESEERTTPVDAGTGCIFRDIDQVRPHIWLLVLVGAWVLLLMMCVLGTCVFTLVR